MSDARVADDLVLEIEPQLSVLHDVPQKCREILRVHLARVPRQRAREVERAENRDAVAHDLGAGLGQLAVATRLSSEVNDDGARLHSLHRRGRDEYRRLLAWNSRGGDDDVGVL